LVCNVQAHIDNSPARKLPIFTNAHTSAGVHSCGYQPAAGLIDLRS